MPETSDIIDAVRRRLEAKRSSPKEEKESSVDMEKVADEMLEAFKGNDKKRLARLLRAWKEI
jgi:hypothetical protein